MRESVFADIRNDFGPAPITPRAACERGAQAVEQAKDVAKRLTDQAQERIDARVKAANDQVAAVLARGRKWLADAAAEL